MMKRRPAMRLVGSALLSLCLAACAESVKPPPAPAPEAAAPGRGIGLYKVGSPYKVNGIWYYPTDSLVYDESGIGSWYGPDFQEHYTANGEVFDQNEVTAAHTILPMPSIVEVTNLENGRSIQVRVNDRGPFIGNRIIDVSRRAAQLLGYEQQGTAKVRVRVLLPETLQAQSLARMNGAEGGPVVADTAPPPVPRLPILAQNLPPPTGAAVSAKPAVPAASPPAAARPAPIIAQTLTPPPAETAKLTAPATIASVALSPPVSTTAPVRVIPGSLPTPLPAPPQVAHNQAVPAGPVLSKVVLVFPVHPTHIFVQAGAFSSDNIAERLKTKLAGVGKASVSAVRINGSDLYRVRFGPLSTVDEADNVLAKAVGAGAPDAKIIVD